MEDSIKLLADVIRGFDYNPKSSVPSVFEKISMEIAEHAKAMHSVAAALDNIAEAIREMRLI